MGKLLNAVRSGDRRSMLCELRDEIATTIEECESGRDMAALSKRLMEVVDEIDTIDTRQEARENPLQAAKRRRAIE